MERIRNKWAQLPQAAKVSTAYAVCSILQRGLLFLTMPLFTRLLTTEQYGQVLIYSSWQGIFQILLTLNLAYGSFSAAMMRFEEDRDGYIASVEGIFFALSGLFFLIYLPFASRWNVLLELPTGLVCCLVADVVCLNALQLWSGKKRFEFKYISVVLVTLISSVVSLLIQFFLVTHQEEKGYARIIGMAAVNILIGGYLMVRSMIRGRKIFDRTYWRYALSFNIPLLAYYLSQMIFNQSDRIMISHMVGIDKAGIYGVAYNFAMVLTFVLDAVNNSYVPWLYGKIRDGEEAGNRSISLGLAAMIALLICGVSWFAPEIIWIMAGEEYMEAVFVVPPVSVSLLLLFYSQLFINVEFYYEEKRSLVFASIGAAVTNLVLNWVFIKAYGFVAAAYTTLFSYIIFAACNCIAMKKVLKRRGLPDRGYNYRGLLLLFAGLCAVTVAGAMLYDYLAVRIVITCLVLAGLFLYRNRILALVRVLQKK